MSFGLDRIDVEHDVSIHLIEGSPRSLPGLPERVSKSTHAALESIGVVVHTNELVTEATALGFETRSGLSIAAEIKIWAAGIKGPPVLAALDGLETNRANPLVVRRTLQKKFP